MAPVIGRLARVLRRLPPGLRERVERALADASALEAADSPASRVHGFEVSKALERAAWAVECCPLPHVAWMRPDRILAVSLYDPVKIPRGLRGEITDPIWTRQDQLLRGVERRCEWFWERCSQGPGPTARSMVKIAPDAGRDEYELIFGDAALE
jgi:hypothetical protein